MGKSLIDELNSPSQSIPGDSRAALEKQQKAVRIFSQLERSILGPLLHSTRRKLMETLISMADTLETLELHAESQAAITEAQVIGNRALGEDSTSQYTYINP